MDKRVEISSNSDFVTYLAAIDWEDCFVKVLNVRNDRYCLGGGDITEASSLCTVNMVIACPYGEKQAIEFEFTGVSCIEMCFDHDVFPEVDIDATKVKFYLDEMKRFNAILSTKMFIIESAGVPGCCDDDARFGEVP